MNIGEILIWESSNDSRRDRPGDADALAPKKAGVHGAGLAPTFGWHTK
jgi:hypothetical protein